MVFNSLTFVVFFAVVLLVYYRLPFKLQNLFLLVASYVFYGSWDVRFVLLLLFTSGFDYFCAIAIEEQRDPRRRRLFLILSISLNMGVLCLFKYFNFFSESLVRLLAVFHLRADFPTLHVILPLGISFYTFLSMSYTIDVYRGEMKATRDWISFLLFVSFFPHLVAGPIVRASYLLPQCERPRTIVSSQLGNGVWLILLGLIKKMVIADRLAGLVNFAFSSSESPPFHGLDTWLALYAFAFQIYGDFAGYSDIARGLSKLMGFELPVNFRAPYLVSNPASFWHHWHISLSTWLRDYLYIPLGGNRLGSVRTYANLFITMLLGGLWHGAGLAYVLWGAYQGTLLVIHRLWSSAFAQTGREERVSPTSFGRRAGRIVWVILFFHLTCLGWLLFRTGAVRGDANQLAILKYYFHSLFSLRGGGGAVAFVVPVLLLGCLSVCFQYKNEAMDRFEFWSSSKKIFAVTAALTAIFALGVFEGAEFIYFQF